MDRHRLLPVLGSLAVLISPVPRLDDDASGLAFHPEEASSFSRTFREETAFEVASFVRRIEGTDIPDPAPSLRGQRIRELEASDTFLSVEDGRPRRVQRSFDSIESSIVVALELEGAEEAHDEDLESPLSGRAVVFAWDEDDERYHCSLADEASGDVRLAGLREDLDLTGLLPAERVSEGDRWSVDASVLEDLFAPGGDLSLHFGYEPDGPLELLALEELAAVALACLADNFADPAGTLEATWSETVVRDERRIAVVELELEATLEADASPRLGRLMDLSGIETEREDATLHTSWELEGEGRLLWDLETGVFRELRVELRARVRLVVGWQQRFGSRDLEHELELELDADTVLSAECRAR